MMKLLIVLFLSLSVFSATSTKPIDSVHINSNNPVFPFPQFLPYTTPSGTLENLGTNNSVGVTHAEMEQTMRDAYRIMMNRATKPGGGVGGIEYIYYRSNPSCSEGDGYGMLGAVAMADKPTFDGLWLWVHDKAMNKVKRYSDCKESSPGYLYSSLPGWTNASNDNSATDGDVDIALALVMAYYQWGEFMGINDACGNPISYKQAAIDFLKGMTDTLTFASSGSTLLSGDIGLDGYFKGGDTWNELTDWASDAARAGVSKPANFKGAAKQHIDYTAPAYFRLFADFLTKENASLYAWNIKQFQRAEASSDWLMGQHFKNDPKNIPFAGWVELSSSNAVTFTNYNEGEDFRLPWRTIMNYVWYGNPTYSWDPVTHQITPAKPNTFESDNGTRYAKFLADNRQSPWSNTCVRGANKDFSYWGPLMLWTDWNVDGSGGNFFFLNWIHGTGSMSAVTSQNFDLMSQMYRQLEIEWDVETGGDGYLTSTPFYFHGWFRLLGLLMLSGNYHAPSAFKATANIKVYLDLDKTFAFQNDSVTYTIDYRNFGSLDASNVIVTDTLHPDFVFLNATGGGICNPATNVVTWNIGTLKGFKTATGIPPTQGQVKLTVKVGNATQKQYRNKVSIACSNGSGWTSNEYPNNKTSVMQRNYLDIAKRALVLKKTATARRIKPGATMQYSINFENTSEAGWINGGRPGVHFSFSQTAPNGNSTMNTMRFRLFHDANEAYIDYGNYRVSYFLYDSLNLGLASAGSTPGWAFMPTIVEGIVDKNTVKLVHELITPGLDSLGKWNQRVVVQFSDPTNPNRILNLATIDHHLSEYRGMRIRIHKGGIDPLRLVWFINSSSWTNVNWSDDWSWDAKASNDDAGVYFPVTNDWTDLEHPDIPVNNWNPKACTTSTHTIKNVLVEEWDGYTWRRVAGNGPMPGRDANNIVIRDTIPKGFTFVSFDSPSPLGIAPVINGNVITWSIPKFQIKQKGTITYTVKADGTCPETTDKITINRAWISADKESPFSDSAIVTISCDTTVKPPTPDHLDIITDTSSIDKIVDAPRLSISMDAATKTNVVYAVVRDRDGNYLTTATTATWTSQNSSVVTVAAQAGNAWQGNITKTGTGSTVIIVTSPGLKSDTMSVSTLAAPPWPVIRSAVLLDTNADLIPDKLLITLSDSLQSDQTLTSVEFTYKGKTYSSTVADVAFTSKTTIAVPCAALTDTDPKPTGTATIVMSVSGTEKRETKTITDGVAPALTNASVLENDGAGPDILYCSFSEPVDTMTLRGNQLLLVKALSGDTVVLKIEAIIAAQNDSMFTLRVSALTNQPKAGDALRLLPGSKSGIIKDKAGNKPHDMNRSVILGQRKGPASIITSYYRDGNADGIIDTLVIGFKRKVAITELLSVKYQWGIMGDTLDINKILMLSDSTFAFPLDGRKNIINPKVVRTDGTMMDTVVFKDFSTIPRISQVADSAAPVIFSARILPGIISPTANTRDPDTLMVMFSEEVQNSFVNPFSTKSKVSGVLYDFQLSAPILQNGVYRFVINGMTPATITMAGNGDSIWINPLSGVKDKNNVTQQNPFNRRVAIEIVWPAPKWVIKLSVNPLIPDVSEIPINLRAQSGISETRGTVVSIKATTPLDISQTTCNVQIFDAIGNNVVSETVLPKNGQYYYCWTGRNHNMRIVGTGTYLAIVTIRGVGFMPSVNKVRIGIKR